MGCDIHLFSERLINNKWINVDNWTANPYYDINDKESDEFDHNSIYSWRYYYLFDVLAGVRGDGDHMIEEPRGLPEDIHYLTHNEYLKHEQIYHSASWFTLQELITFSKKYKDERAEILLPIINPILEVIKKENFIKNNKLIPPEFIRQYRIVFWFDN